jgi:hypothetical protein
MNYNQMLPVVDEWVLWVLSLLTPLVALCALTAFIVLHRERKTATRAKRTKNLLVAGGAGLLTLLILGFMLFSGLKIEENRANATQNIMAKYDVSSVTWRTPDNRHTNPTDTVSDRIVMVTDHENNVTVFKFSANPDTSEPQLEDTAEGAVKDSFRRIPAETLLKK